MISKELLSKVLGCHISYITEKVDKLNRVELGEIINEMVECRKINIYELAHKCKEWAKLKYFIDIDSHCDCARWGAEATSHNGRPSVFYEQVFIGRTEPEAIFKACEYILKELSNK